MSGHRFKTTHNVTAVLLVLLETIVQPDELLVLAHHKEIGFRVAGQRGPGVHRELHLVLLAQRIRNVHQQTVVAQRRRRRRRHADQSAAAQWGRLVRRHRRRAAVFVADAGGQRTDIVDGRGRRR